MMGQKKFEMKQYHNLSLDALVSPHDLYRKIDSALDFNFICLAPVRKIVIPAEAGIQLDSGSPCGRPE